MAEQDRMNDRDERQNGNNTDPYREPQLDPDNNDRDRDRQTQPGQELPGNDQNDEEMDEDSDMDEEEGEQI